VANGATPGSITLQFASTNTTDVTMKAGSAIQCTKAN
jgi:hypothetical protein